METLSFCERGMSGGRGLNVKVTVYIIIVN